MPDYDEDLAFIEDLLEDTGIEVVSKKTPSDLTRKLSVIVAGRGRLALSFRKQNIGHIIRTEGQDGDVWQAQEISTIVSEDLHRVCFELAAYHPDLD